MESGFIELYFNSYSGMPLIPLRFIKATKERSIEFVYSFNDKFHIKKGRLNASTSPNDMNLPGLFLHPLTGNRSDIWSVRVNGNWRVAFRFNGAHAEIVNYEDYH